MGEQVQAEFARRKALEKAYNGNSVLSAKLVCEEYGAFFGPKVWLSTDRYRRTIWQGNDKFASEEHCHTPHWTQKLYSGFLSKPTI